MNRVLNVVYFNISKDRVYYPEDLINNLIN
jgi:hypothetical protein